jgi:hypothetical protein
VCRVRAIAPPFCRGNLTEISQSALRNLRRESTSFKLKQTMDHHTCCYCFCTHFYVNGQTFSLFCHLSRFCLDACMKYLSTLIRTRYNLEGFLEGWTRELLCERFGERFEWGDVWELNWREENRGWKQGSQAFFASPLDLVVVDDWTVKYWESISLH